MDIKGCRLRLMKVIVLIEITVIIILRIIRLTPRLELCGSRGLLKLLDNCFRVIKLLTAERQVAAWFPVTSFCLQKAGIGGLVSFIRCVHWFYSHVRSLLY